ncbi:hypothetical protein [Lutimonas sp.]|uniref:hypothetical protein n=1 Tax=Lutimonas sp. TaxID=1872403 RepID=UPI003D9B4E7F
MSTYKSIYLGENEASFEAQKIKGELLSFDNEDYYMISNNDAMRPFFMSIVSDSNHWMFISSNGGLTAGRKDSGSSLFPYYTDDKITESTEITGSKTILRVEKNNKLYLWEPFSDKYEGIYKIHRNLYKNSFGNKVIFEEINKDLGLIYRYQWNSSDRFGFVRKSTLINTTKSKTNVSLVDGLQNILPYGVNAPLQNDRSNLVDAYKKCELEVESGIGIYALSAIIVDKAEPSEALKASIVWSLGMDKPTHLLTSLQLDTFRKGGEIEQEVDMKAEKGAYFVGTEVSLGGGEEKHWIIVANVNQSMVTIREISDLIQHEKDLSKIIQDDIELGSKNLLALNAASDGMQLTADKLMNTRHFSNTLFNIMRGGIFDNGYQIEKWDFVQYLETANKKVFKKKQELLENLPEVFSLSHLKSLAEKDQDKNFKRLAIEYMPLKFSRRHGDPSRPWNKFSINTTNELDGSKILDYEGNWRDIFQNWEALAHSYPEFMESMIHKFLNATTFDGYNPYRVTKDGFDWETIEPDDPWSYIGYWGDHQIIYLLKFLEFIEYHYPNRLAHYFDKEMFVYANVPYRIKSYEDILKNPKDTIDFDHEADERIAQKRLELGADGALLRDENFFIYKVNLIEKLLATVLAKISNFIPEGGIWMNTQRPEWNDANNALVGNGVSMVTLYYLRRFLHFFEGIIEKMDEQSIEVSVELSQFFSRVTTTFKENQQILNGKVSDKKRKIVLDGLGQAASDFRLGIYDNGFSSDKELISKADLLGFLEISKKFLDHSIEANKRNDNLYHAYNLMTVENENEVSISYLPEMLEGQVAVLSSGYINGADSLELLDALKKSALFRDDQYSYILYPNKELPRFDVKNNIPSEKVESSVLLKQLLEDGNVQIVQQDMAGVCHFNGAFNNADSLKEALGNLPEKYDKLVEEDGPLLLDIFESIFDHKSFTGRSGTFFGYEGLGSIYWHMVSKLVLGIQETCLAAIKNGVDKKTIGRLLDHYYEANAGIGVHKSPELYGAFPTDPYSHTPGGKGAQQPGMTGQVKEDILSRFGELGVFVRDGKLSFSPNLLRREEFLTSAQTFHYVDLDHKPQTLKVGVDALCFTYCQIPIIYQVSDHTGIQVVYDKNNVSTFSSLSLDGRTSKKVFERTGEIEKIIVSIENSRIK